MDKIEFTKFAMVLKTAYPKDNLLPSKESMSIWYQMLMDIPYDIAEVALRRWISTNKWAPSIADIREYSTAINEGETPSWGEAWQTVLRAVSKYGYMNEQRALNSLQPLARRATEMIGFQTICTSENIAMERANFRKCYEAIAEREKEDAQLPKALLDTIKTLQLGEFKDEPMLPIHSEGTTDNKEEQPENGSEQENEEVVSDPLQSIRRIREILSKCSTGAGTPEPDRLSS